ncbi:MAG: phenylacetate--CoA ligase family protein [Burkholderiales bacterium]
MAMHHKPSTLEGAFTRARKSSYLLAASAIERRIPWWPTERIERLQHRRIRAMLDYAYRNVPFYRRVLDERGLAPSDFAGAGDLERLPLIDGATLSANPDDLTAEQYRHEGREVFNTSGSTTGIRKRICWDHGALMRRFARGERDRIVITRLASESWAASMLREFVTTERARTLASRLLRIDSEAHQRLQILPADFSSRTMRAIGSERSLIPRRPLHYHHLSPTAPFEVAAAQIRAIKPRVVYSFGSYAEQFFRYLADCGADVPLPRLWVYLGDMVSDVARDLADELGCRLYSVYGAMEAGTIGFQCERREGFHLNVDLCAVRIVDAKGRTLPPGTSGDIVISSLDNHATVLLNYRIGDRGTLSPQPCPCGRSLPLLASLEGRRSEMIRLPDGRAISSLMLEGMFRAELRRTRQAQIEQLGPGELRWHIVPFASADREALRAAFAARAAQTLGPATTLTIEFREQIERTEQGKFVRAIVRSTGSDHAAR